MNAICPLPRFDVAALSGLGELSAVAQLCWLRYGTAPKLANAVALEQERKAGVARVSAYPWRLVLEPINTCNLRCPGCETHGSNLPRGRLTVEAMDQYLAELWPYLVQVNLFNWGEPLLNPELDRLVGRLHEQGVGTQIHTNLNYFCEAQAAAVISGGLDVLVASIDGVTQTTYEGYRAGGDLERVLANLETVVALRDRYAPGHLRVVWRMLSFRHNAGELEAARRRADGLGVDFATAPGYLNGETPAAAERACNGDCGSCGAGSRRAGCRDLYDFPVIHWNGMLLPCCFASSQRFVFGRLPGTSWKAAFNSAAFRAARNHVQGRGQVSPCDGCFKLS